MSAPIVISVYSNGNIWVSTDGVVPSSEAGTLLKHFRINGHPTVQKITTLTGSGNSSASALAASGSTTSRHGKNGLDNEDFN